MGAHNDGHTRKIAVIVTNMFNHSHLVNGRCYNTDTPESFMIYIYKKFKKLFYSTTGSDNKQIFVTLVLLYIPPLALCRLGVLACFATVDTWAALTV